MRGTVGPGRWTICSARSLCRHGTARQPVESGSAPGSHDHERSALSQSLPVADYAHDVGEHLPTSDSRFAIAHMPANMSLLIDDSSLVDVLLPSDTSETRSYTKGRTTCGGWRGQLCKDVPGLADAARFIRCCEARSSVRSSSRPYQLQQHRGIVIESRAVGVSKRHLNICPSLAWYPHPEPSRHPTKNSRPLVRERTDTGSIQSISWHCLSLGPDHDSSHCH
jgi:hypothetical protein